jgi:hypothetical protein
VASSNSWPARKTLDALCFGRTTGKRQFRMLHAGESGWTSDRLRRIAHSAAAETLPRRRKGRSPTRNQKLRPVTEADRGGTVGRSLRNIRNGILARSWQQVTSSMLADRSDRRQRAFISGLPVWGTLVS